MQTFPRYLLVFALSFFYSCLVCKGGVFLQNVAGLLFVTFLFCHLIINVWKVTGPHILDGVAREALAFIPLTHLGILLGFIVCGGAETLLWARDSYDIHVPGAINIANFLKGIEGVRETSSPIDRIYLTHWIVGTFFLIFGANPVASGLALMLINWLTSLLIYKLALRITDKKVAVSALLIFATAPTVMFYSLVYYKEAVIQLLVIAFFYCFHLFYLKQSLWPFLGALASLAVLLSERFYLALMLGTPIVLVIFVSKTIQWYLKTGVIFLCAITGWFIYKKFSGFYIDFSQILLSLKMAQQVYNAYPDIDPKINTQLPYILAVIKIYLTPIFTPVKITLFHGYSTLITWGSFLHQFIAGMAFVSLIKKKWPWRETALLLLPFVLFLLLFGYIAPYNGRLRDSFYPLLALLCAPSLLSLIDWLKGRVRSNP